MNELRYSAIIGQERALIDALSKALQAIVGGPPPSKATLAQLRRHNSARITQTDQGNRFEVQIVGPDGQPTGHIVRVTVELERFGDACPEGAHCEFSEWRHGPLGSQRTCRCGYVAHA